MERKMQGQEELSTLGIYKGGKSWEEESDDRICHFILLLQTAVGTSTYHL
jgi:hypothetical protein